MGQVVRSNRRLKSSLELQQMQFSLIRTVWQTVNCGYCDLIFRAANKIIDRGNGLKFDIFQSISNITLAEDQPILLTVRCLTDSRDSRVKTNTGIELFKIPDTTVPGLSTIGSATPIAPDAASYCCFDFIKSNLKACKETHSSCRQQEPSGLPKRVLRLDTPLGTSTAPSVKLYISVPSEKQDYIAAKPLLGSRYEKNS